jgi:hypothetical protein
MGSTPESTHPKGPVIVWVNYGLEGWAPKEFDNDQAAIDFILQGGHGSPMVITSVMQLVPRDAPALKGDPYSAGRRDAFTRILNEAVIGLHVSGVTEESWRLERASLVATLRRVCDELGTNDWPENLSLSDVIDKYLLPHIPETDDDA